MSKIIAPAWALRTRSAPMHTLDAALALALALRIHRRSEAIRSTAARLRDRVPLENRTQMSKIMRSADPINIVEQIIANATRALGL